MKDWKARCAVAVLIMAMGAGSAAASPIISGMVVSADGEPLPRAHVYLAGTMVGTVTRHDGSFRLGPVPLGAHRVVASMVGYEVASEDVVLRESGVHDLTFTMRPAVHTLGTVDVSAREQRRWLRRLERFERTLFGTSTFADSVRLLNPEVLDFTVRLGQLRATARAPLQIENRALGYRIRYDLRIFEALPHRVRYDGEPFFEELDPRDEAEAARWAANRQRAYRGSLRHLFLAMIDDEVETRGFRLQHRPTAGPGAAGVFTPADPSAFARPIRAREILSPAEHEGEYRLAFRGILVITYHREPEDPRFPAWEWNVDGHAHPRAYQRSEIYLTDGPSLVDGRGELDDALGVTRRGYLAFRRLAMLLPVEYTSEEPLRR